ncbi:MAG TPA: hypothetical protein VIL30_23690 [Ramlibacter sp.]|jgi:hypothetical protein
MLAALLPLCIFAPAGAQSLGTASADPWVGRPLEMSVPARFASADAGDECVQADVFYGDQRLSRDRIRATVFGPPGDRQVRVAVDAAVDEPVITVSLRAGCRNTVTRTYTLLPQMPSTPVLAAAAARTAGAGAVPVASPIRLTSASSSTTLRPVRAAAEGPTRARAARMERARDSGGTPRLRLDMWEPEPQAPAQAQATLLRVSAQLSQPTQDAAARATAALLWQALNADPSELLRTSLTLQRLEGELANLRTTADQTRAEMAALRQVLEAPPSGIRITGPLAQALMFLVLAGAAIAAFLWWRTARQQHAGGWNGQPLDSRLDDSVLPTPEPVPQPQPQVVERTADAPRPAAAPVRPAPAWTVEGGVVLPAVPVARAELAPLDFELQPPAPAPAQAAPVVHGPQLRVETLAATFQEVEFLTSLGLWGDASDVLKKYIEDSSAPAPIAYFELMRLYDHADDAVGMGAVRRRYAQVFGAEPPPLEQINGPHGLQSRAELAARITRNWGKPQSLDMIEDLLFAVPVPDKALSLEAGRDLLCLYQVAMELQREDAAGAGGTDEHGLAPWAHAEDAGQAHAAAQAAADFAGGYDFALDLDLNAQAAPVLQPEPELPAEPLELEDPEADFLLAEFEAATRGEILPRETPRLDPAPAPDHDAFSDAVANEGRRPLPR